MFQKLLSNLPFNPSLIGKVTFYTQRLRKEAFVRRLGVFFIIAAIGVQLFAMVAPAQPSLAASANDLKYGGFSSQGDIVNYCQENAEYRGILQHFGVECIDIFFGTVKNVNSRDYDGKLLSMGRLDYPIAGEQPVNIPGLGTYYMRYLWGWDAPGTTSNYQSVVGTRQDGTTFVILFDCGNLAIIGTPPPPTPAPKIISCSNLFMSVAAGSKVPINTVIKVNGQASGANLPPGELVDMNYDYVTDTGAVLGTDRASGIPFSGGTATDNDQRSFTVTKPGHFFFRVFVKYESGTKEAIPSFACLKDVYVETPPPEKPPEKELECTALIPSFNSGQVVVTGTKVTVRGQAGGKHIPAGEKVDMYYDYTDAAGKVIDADKALGVAFSGASAIDKTPREFKLDKAGTYNFRLAVKYDNSSKSAAGNLTGNCIKKIVVQPPCEQAKTNDEVECIILNKKAKNDTQNIPDANETVAHAGDVVTYTLSAKNTSKNTTIKKFIVEENITDVLEYADVVDLHGGVKDDKNTVKWPATDVKAGQTIEKQLTVRIKNPIPNTPIASSNPGSFDMTMTNKYGTSVNIKLPPTVTKTTEQVTRSLPNTGPGETMVVGFTLTAIVGYFLARNRLMIKELELVRSDYAVSGGV